MSARLVLLAALALVAAADARAASTPDVPVAVQAKIRAQAATLAYVPTRLPLRYRYRAFHYNRSAGRLVIRFADVRFLPDPRHRLYFVVARYRGRPDRCGDGREKTLQMGGNRVYSGLGVVWRCIRTPRGSFVKVTVTGEKLPDVGLGRVAASAKRID